MVDQNERPALQSVFEATFATLRKVHRDHECVFGSEVLYRVLMNCGYRSAVAMPVRAEILNAAMFDYVQKFGMPRPDETNDVLEATGALRRIVGGQPGAVWEAGHLGIVVPGQGSTGWAFLDLTICQGDVPERGIALRPLLLEVAEDFVMGDERHVEMVNGCQITYEPFPDDHAYQWSDNNWMGIPALSHCVLLTLGQLESES